MSLRKENPSGESPLSKACRSRIRLTIALRVLVLGDGLGDNFASLDGLSEFSIADIPSNNNSPESNGFSIGLTTFSGVISSSKLRDTSSE